MFPYDFVKYHVLMISKSHFHTHPYILITLYDNGEDFGRHKVTKISLVTKISTDFCFCRLFLLPTIFYADFFLCRLFFLPIRYFTFFFPMIYHTRVFEVVFKISFFRRSRRRRRAAGAKNCPQKIFMKVKKYH